MESFNPLNRNLSNILLYLVAMLIIASGCSSSKPYTLRPVKTFDPDTAAIPEPNEHASYQYWDRIDNTIFHQLEKPLDLNNVFRSAGQLFGIADAEPADNVNHLDEVPESSWYTYRHYHDTMTTRELARGPNTLKPDTSGKWTIFSAKMEGANPGFFIEDASGNRFLIKFDGPNNPELATSASVIGTKIFYAAGYNVPEATITYFDPEQVTIGEGVQVMEKGKKRPMTREDYREIISNKTTNTDGKIRAVASKFVDGKIVGPWAFEGTRKDDPNDRVAHEHRREVRGMRVISSWLNDTDRRDANTMSIYTDDGYIKHYVQDFGNTLGANGAFIHTPIYGQAYLIDPRYMTLSALTLGMYVTPWEIVDTQAHIPHPSVGYYRADIFKPGRWVSAHPLPAYENMTLRDAFWGAKIVMSFSNEDLEAIVETGKLTNPEAEEYLTDILKKRRDKIGRYWFSRINPIDKFQATRDGSRLTLAFKDLGVEGELFDADDTFYEYSVATTDGKQLINSQTNPKPRITFSRSIIPSTKQSHKPTVLKYEIITRRESKDVAEKSTQVYVVLRSSGPKVKGIEREE